MPTNGLTTLDLDQCQAVNGGIGPLLAGAYAVVTSKPFVAFATTLTLVSFAADVATDVLE